MQDEAGNTPLHTAVHVSCHHAVERITAQSNFDYRVVNNDELTVLHLAVVKGDIRSVRLSFALISHPVFISRGWLGSRVVSVLDSGAEGPGFKSQPRRCRVTVLGKLFTPIVLLFTKQQNW